MVVVFSVLNTVMMAPYLVFGVVIAKDRLGGATAWGAILGAQGAGAVAGGVIMLRMRLGRPLLAALTSFLVWPFALISLAYGAPVPVIATGAFLCGASFAVFGTRWDTTMQREVPPELLSR